MSLAKYPKVMDHIKSQIVEDGDKVTFTATVGGGDKFDVVWLHNEKEIKPSKVCMKFSSNFKWIFPFLLYKIRG